MRCLILVLISSCTGTIPSNPGQVGTWKISDTDLMISWHVTIYDDTTSVTDFKPHVQKRMMEQLKLERLPNGTVKYLIEGINRDKGEYYLYDPNVGTLELWDNSGVVNNLNIEKLNKPML